MPVLRQQLSLLGRGLRAFLNLEAGVTRADDAPEQGRDLGFEETRRLLATKDREIAQLRARLGKNSSGGEGGIRPEKIIWIFGYARTGSTWLSSMMEDLTGQTVWREPMVGLLFGHLYYVWAHEGRRGAKNFILGRYKESWLRSIRNFVLDEAQTRFPELEEEGYLVIKEPNGSIGAPLMMEALPESRMVLLVRDPRDAIASILDARRKGGWSYERNRRRLPEQSLALANEDPLAYTKERAQNYLESMGKAKEAYGIHRGYKVLVKYEDLVTDTLGTMRRIYSTLDVPVDEGELTWVVEKHSWENVPKENKGEGKFYRKATPGSWAEDLTPEQVEVVESITTPLLEEFYRDETRRISPLKRLPSDQQQKNKISGV